MHRRDRSVISEFERERKKKKSEVTLGKLTICVTTNIFYLVSAGLPCARAWGMGAEEEGGAQRAICIQASSCEKDFPTHC